jgi:hypothetical protein
MIQIILFIGANVLGTVGMFFCAAVPSRSLAKGSAVVASLAFSLATVCSLILGLTTLVALSATVPSREDGKLMQYIPFILIGSLLVAFVLCLLFQALVAAYARASGTLGSIVGYLAFFLASPWALITFAMFMADAERGSAMGMRPVRSGPFGSFESVGPIFLMLSAVLCVWFIVNSFSLSGAVNRASRRGEI